MPKTSKRRRVRQVLELSGKTEGKPLSRGLQTQFEAFRMLARRHHEARIEFPFLKPKP